MIYLFFFFFGAACLAQDSVYTLSPVEVSDVRTGLNNFQSYIYLEENTIQRGQTGLSLEESLYIVPGVTIINRNNPSMGDKISIRGIGSRASFGVRGIRIMLDNIPLTMPDGQTQTNNIDLISTGRINILKGPASSFYGNASGGVIKLYTEIPSDKILSVEPRVLAGEDNLYKYTMKLSGSANNHSYLVSFNNTLYDGYRDHSSQKSYHINSVYKNIVNEDMLLSAVLNFYSAPYQQNPSTLDRQAVGENRRQVREFIKNQGAGQKTNQFQGGVNFIYAGSYLNLESTIYYVKRNLLNPIPGRIIDLNRDVVGFRSAVSKEFILNSTRIEITGGADIEHQADDRSEFVNGGIIQGDLKPSEIFENLNYGNQVLNQKENITGAGPFAAAEFMFNNKFGFISVLRYDHYNYSVSDYLTDNSGSRTMKQFSPSAGLLFKPDLYSRIYLNYATSFQTPTTVELSNRPDGKGGFNPELEPEKIRQIELGGEYLLQFLNTSVSASVYTMNFDDLLIPFQSTFSEEIFYRNAGKAVNRGVELNTLIFLTEYLSAEVSYNYMKFRFDDYIVNYNNSGYQLKDNYVPGIPPQTVSLNINYSAPKGIWGKVNMQWNDEYYANDFNGPPPGSSSSLQNFSNEAYLWTSIRLGWLFEFGKIETDFFIGTNNVLDVKYNGAVVPNAAGERYFEPAPGRTFYAGIALKL